MSLKSLIEAINETPNPALFPVLAVPSDVRAGTSSPTASTPSPLGTAPYTIEDDISLYAGSLR